MGNVKVANSGIFLQGNQNHTINAQGELKNKLSKNQVKPYLLHSGVDTLTRCLRWQALDSPLVVGLLP